jgi:hypothetical protein
MPREFFALSTIFFIFSVQPSRLFRHPSLEPGGSENEAGGDVRLPHYTLFSSC